MATRKSKATKQDIEQINDANHNCVQCEVIGEIHGRLDAQEATDSRIEASIQQLVKNHNEELKQSSKDFTELKCTVARVGTALDQSVKNQTEMITQMKNLLVQSATMQQSQTETKNLFEKHIHESDAWRTSMERRLGKLERTRWFWYTLVGLLVGLVGFISYATTIYDYLIKK